MNAIEIGKLGLVLAVFILLGLVAAPSAVCQIDALSIAELGGSNQEGIRFARSINVSGQVAGRVGYVTGSETRAVLWTLGGTQTLGTLSGGDYSGAFAINDFGQVVGTSNTGDAVRAFRWGIITGIEDLGTLSTDTGSEAFDINNHGQVVGTSSGPNGIRAVLWKSNGKITNLGTLPGGDDSRAFAINNSGQVVGTSTSPSGSRAFLWTGDAGMRDLGTLPGDDSSEALDINNSGQVVGYSSGPNGTRAFLWTSSAGMKNLGTLPGGNYSRAFGINNLGLIVGSSNSPNGLRAVVWSSIAILQDVNVLISALSPDLVLSEAHCINDLGMIVALSGGGEQAPTAAGDTHEQEHFYRVFLLTPLQTLTASKNSQSTSP